MHAIIVGAGEVGWYLAQRLGAEGNDIVVIERNEVVASDIGQELDVQVVVGDATLPSVLRAAGLDKAELLCGVTQSDEVNLICSLLAKEAGVAQTVVRIQAEELRGPDGAAVRAAMRADVVIDPDADTADAIMSLVDVAGADEVYAMSGGDVEMIGAVIGVDAPVAGQSLADVGRTFGEDWGFAFGALTREGVTTIPHGGQQLAPGDHVRVLTRKRDRDRLLDLLGATLTRPKRAMVLGAGAIGTRVARRLHEAGTDVVLVERDLGRARQLSERLPGVTIVHGDIQDTDFLDEEAITQMDLVVAATGVDAANVLACAFAASTRRTFTVAVLHRLSLLPLVRRFGIDAALSPRTSSANTVLRHIRGGKGTVSTFLESDVEVDEVAVEPGSAADGVVVAELTLPADIVLGAVVRADGSGAVINGATRLHGGDTVVVFVRPGSLRELHRAFSA